MDVALWREVLVVNRWCKEGGRSLPPPSKRQCCSVATEAGRTVKQSLHTHYLSEQLITGTVLTDTLIPLYLNKACECICICSHILILTYAQGMYIWKAVNTIHSSCMLQNKCQFDFDDKVLIELIKLQGHFVITVGATECWTEHGSSPLQYLIHLV